ncbi:hypothetical protein GCM10007036_28570 [Alsobacter metallidurans]|uniref:Methyl-accepting transducer domain-containing protein n=1 Tax=Alsobacter metallidurans TaxID=340221 RepID=A0A917MKD9_9HYPH|nr:methyl-accepting chemotaxis protein [Alsobacter metallidurans]GGH23076.1 hypothetical protein GCM10007036_28570 [Alsobacter metallidurans]
MSRPHHIWLTCLGLLVLICASIAAHVFEFSRLAVSDAEAYATNVATAASAGIEQIFSNVDSNIKVTRNILTEIRDLDAFAYKFSRYVHPERHTIQIAVLDRSGMLVFSSMSAVKSPTDLSDRSYFQFHANLSDDVLFVGSPVAGRRDVWNGAWFIPVSRRITNPDGSFGGVIVATLDPYYFAKAFDEIDIGEDGALTMISEYGAVVSRRGLTKDTIGKSMAGSHLLALARSKPLGLLDGVDEIDGKRRLTAYRALGTSGLMLAVGLSHERAFGAAERQAGLGVVGALASGAIVIGLGAAFARSRRRLDRNQALLEQASASNQAKDAELSALQIEESRLRRELDLARGLEAFENTVHITAMQISASIDQLGGASAALSNRAGETRQHAADVLGVAERALSRTEQVVEMASELVALSERINDSAAATSGLADRSVEGARETDTVVQALDAAAAEIDFVASFIAGVARQTNLLALNATIEAARAGERGRGFAVVASEVKALAEQTGQAAQKIAVQTQAIKEAGGRTAHVVRDIAQSIHDVAAISRTVASATGEQAKYSAAIERSIAKVQGENEGLALAAERLNGATAEAEAVVADVVELASSLRLHASTLTAQSETVSMGLLRAQRQQSQG